MVQVEMNEGETNRVEFDEVTRSFTVPLHIQQSELIHQGDYGKCLDPPDRYSFLAGAVRLLNSLRTSPALRTSRTDCQESC